MSKKAWIIVGLAAVIAATTGVAFASNGGTLHPRGTDGDPVIASSQTAGNDSEYNADGQAIGESGDTSVPVSSEETSEPDDAVEDADTTEAAPSDDDAENPVSSSGSLVAEYSIHRIIERETGEEQSPRVIFGKFFNSCYLRLYSDSTLELMLNPTTGVSQTGVFETDDDVMSVEFDNDSHASYQIIYADNGDIDFIIVQDGAYNIYFGQ